jgi:hypothetical protein
MKIREVRAELFHADRRTDRHDKTNSRLSQLCDSAQKEIVFGVDSSITTLRSHP